MRWLVVLLFVLPAAHAQVGPGLHNDPGPAETTLYLHGDPYAEMALNTQEPDPRATVGGSAGLFTATRTCLPATGSGQREHHAWLAHATPTYTHFDPEDGGRVRYEPVRGVARDVRLDTSSPVRLVWYLEGDLDSEPSPLPAPEVVLRVTLREGDEVGWPPHGGDGRVIAQAETEPALLAARATPQHPQVRYVPVEGPDGARHVYEFTLDLPYAEPGLDAQVPAGRGFDLRVDAFVDNAACDAAGGSVMPNTLNLHSSHGHRPRLTWDVLDPLRVVHLVPVFVGDDLVVHAGVDSPWGAYDVRGDRAGEPQFRLTVEGPTEARSLEPRSFHARSYDPDHHVHPVRQSWVWPHRADGAADGLYTVRLTVQNDQGTATSTAVATFEVGSGAATGCTLVDGTPHCAATEPTPARQSPAAGTVVPLLALAAGVLLLRRR